MGSPLLQPGQSAVLPQDGGRVGQGALQPLVAAHQRPVAQLQPLVEHLPELLAVAAGGEGHVHQIDGHHALVEPAVVLGLSGLWIHVGGEEGAAAHAGVALALPVLIHLVLLHDLLGDVVGHQAAGGALGGQPGQIVVGGAGVHVVLLQHIDELGEGRGDPNPLLVLYALIALYQGLLDDEGQIPLGLGIVYLAQVHEHGDEGGLSVGGHEGDHLVLDGLHPTADLLPQALLHDAGEHLLRGGAAHGGDLRQHLPADLLPGDLDEGGQVGQGDGLAAVLVGGHLGDDLGGDVAGGGKAVGLFDEGARDDGAVLEHVLQVDQIAVVHVLGVVVHVVEVDDARLVGLHDVGGEQQPLGDVLGHLAGHVVPLNRVDHRVLVGVLLLGLLVVALDEGEDLAVGGVGRPGQGADIAVADVALGGLKGAQAHNLGLHQLLNLLHGQGAAHPGGGLLHAEGELGHLPAGQLRRLVGGQIGFGDGGGDLLPVKGGLAAVALHDFHWCCHSLQFICPLHYIGLTGKAQYYIWRFVKSDRPGWNSGAGHGIIDKTDSEAPEGATGRSGGICGAH